MTINDVIQGIVNALNEKFGSGYKYYTERVEQSLVEPCFLVKCLDPAIDRHIGRRFWKTHQFSVQYFPLDQNSYFECMVVLDRLFECMVDISVGTNILHGINLFGEMTDGVLTFTVNYNLFVLGDDDPEVDMEDLTVEVSPKEG